MVINDYANQIEKMEKQALKRLEDIQEAKNKTRESEKN